MNFNLKITNGNYLENLANDLHELNKSKGFENLLIDLFKCNKNLVEIKNNCLFTMNNDNVDLLLKYEYTLLDVKLEPKIFVFSYHNIKWIKFKDLIDAIGTSAWAYEADAVLIFLTGISKQNKSKWIKKLKRKMERLDINIPVRIYRGIEVAKFIVEQDKTGSLINI